MINMSLAGMYRPKPSCLINNILDRFCVYHSTISKNGYSGVLYVEDAIIGSKRPYAFHRWCYPRIWWMPWRRDMSVITVQTYYMNVYGKSSYFGETRYTSDFELISGTEHRSIDISRIKSDILNNEIHKLLKG